jgi:hypothetical protein
MADNTNEALKALKRFVNDQHTVTVLAASVVSVDEDALTCDVSDGEDTELYDVRLRAAIDGSDQGPVMIPAVGSPVLIGNIGNSPNSYFVISYTAVSKVAFLIGTSKIEMAADGIAIERNAQSLKDALNSLLDAIKTITVTCASPGTPSTVPINVAAFDAVKTQINQILK